MSSENGSTGCAGEGTRHFWACSFPPASSTLCVVRGSASEAAAPVQVLLFDPDGELFNEVTLKLTEAPLVSLELEHLLEPCKLESGLRHARIAVSLPAGYSAFMRHNDRTRAVMNGTAETAPLVAPIVTGGNRSCLVSLINPEPRTAQVRVKLFVQNRTPEVIMQVPPGGVRLCRIESEFREVLDSIGERTALESLRGYVRITPRTDENIVCQIIELSERREEGSYLVAVT